MLEQMSVPALVDALVDYEGVPDTVDDNIGVPGFLGTTTRGAFLPNERITDARQRVLFRMVHTQRPLQEKMALFWHNHFATGFSKIAGQIGPDGASRALGAKPSEDAKGLRGQYELFREYALGNFRDLLVQVSQDPAMVAWLDGDTNLKANSQKNYARELMELFTMGVEFYTESDVAEGARVFTGWNLAKNRVGETRYATFLYRPDEHDTGSKTFSFPIYPDGGKTIPARSAAGGMQDGLDFIDAVVAHPETGPQAVRFFSSQNSPRRRRRLCSSWPASTTPARGRHTAQFGRIPRPHALFHAVLVARGVRCAAHEVGGVDGVLRGRCGRSAGEHGADPLRTTGCLRVAPWDELVLHRHPLGTYELRVVFGRQPAVQLGRRRDPAVRYATGARGLHGRPARAGGLRQLGRSRSTGLRERGRRVDRVPDPGARQGGRSGASHRWVV
jgi:hypothetical protein